MKNSFVVISSANHPLVDEYQISLNGLVKYAFVVRETVSATCMAIERFFAEYVIEMKTTMEMVNNEVIK